MIITMLGISHHTAPLEVREKLALTPEQIEVAMTQWREQYPLAQLVLLNTCNRSEWYMARPNQQPPDVEQLQTFMTDLTGTDPQIISSVTILRENQEAVEHLLGVASGLDSMVLGEPQILGQIKTAYERAVSFKCVDTALHTLFQEALAVGKQVRSTTGIDAGRMSVGSVAIDFARQIFERFDDKTVVAIGAGDIAKLTLRHLQDLSPKKLWLVNRSIDRVRSLAEELGVAHVRSFDELDELLVEADIVITSTGSTKPIITAQRFKPLQKRRRSRPLFIIDLAVPRDVEAKVGSLSNVYLYNIDDLQQVVQRTQNSRSSEAKRAQELVTESAAVCMAQIQNHDIGRLIRSLRNRLHEMGKIEQQRTLRKLESTLPEHMPQLLEEHTQRLINKILHMPVSQLDRRQPASVLGFFAAALRRLFRLDDEGDMANSSVEEDSPEPVSAQSISEDDQ